MDGSVFTHYTDNIHTINGIWVCLCLSENEDILNSNVFLSCSLLILLKRLFIGIPYFDIVYIGIAIYCYFIGIAYMFVPSNPCCDVLSYWYSNVFGDFGVTGGAEQCGLQGMCRLGPLGVLEIQR